MLHVRQIQAIVNHCQLQVTNQNKALHRWPDGDIATWTRDPFSQVLSLPARGNAEEQQQTQQTEAKIPCRL
jgi:hypothetical protein